jgi:hypothetical protein
LSGGHGTGSPGRLRWLELAVQTLGKEKVCTEISWAHRRWKIAPVPIRQSTIPHNW